MADTNVETQIAVALTAVVHGGIEAAAGIADKLAALPGYDEETARGIAAAIRLLKTNVDGLLKRSKQDERGSEP